jgi:PknH-like extracellular domain
MRGSVVTVAAVVASVLAGCSSTVTGSAIRDPNATPTDVRPLREAQLDGVMLGVERLNGIVGATRLEVVVDARQMSDNSDTVSDPDCVGSMFGAEDLVHRTSGWAAVRDHVAREPGDGSEHWVEQTVVLYPTEREASDFVKAATSSWRDCSGFSVVVDDETTSSIWLIDDVSVRDDVVTQVVAQEDSEGWECQHALTSVANVSIEALACAFGVDDEAVGVVDALVANAAKA